jgi:antitoxin component YwqK of YwqJK toxin-antitoxin module
MEIKSYHKNGEIHQTKEYVSDDIIIYRKYYNNKNIEIETTYHFNYKYHINGKLKKCTLYKKIKQYHMNGKLELKCTLIDDEYDGLYTSYYEDGEMSENIYYEMGKAIIMQSF